MITIADIRRRISTGGSRFLDPETMRFWDSRLINRVYEGAEDRAYFVTSETDSTGRDRRYTVRMSREDGSVETVGEFRAYRDRWAGLRAASIAANNDMDSASV
jgi:hypothetical protein